jgi:hypothetical protein
MRVVRGVVNVVIMLSVPLWVLPYWIKEISCSTYERIEFIELISGKKWFGE